LSEYMSVKKSMLEKKTWAVIGANNNPDKFGNIIYRKLKAEGYAVYPVNPLCDKVDGDQCYPDLSSLPELPEVLDMVISPKLGIENIWLQPGTYNSELLALIKEKQLIAIQACVLVALG